MFSIISAGLAPGVALLSFFYLKDKYEPEPIRLVFRLFLIGALLVFPIMVLQYAFQLEYSLSPLIDAFIISGLSEEFFKWFVVYYTVFKHAEFNEHYDGVVYAVAASLGFATLENILYIFANGIDTAFVRAVLPVPSHALFGVIMGYYFGKSKMNNNKKLLVVSLIIPAILHGIYNYILMSSMNEWLYTMVPFMIFLWWLGLKKMKDASSSIKQNSYTFNK
jgi:protease PrsW